ncbi:hypothetical protein ABKW28_19220 [Nocardioides sp. 31GB23]|uniref:hypothetical protein n=1 Tax=Nocardioides sp. 31GB23 TaxID=3156065 RepID=UPI0032AEA8E8
MPADIPFGAIGDIGLVLALFWLLASGRLATRRELDDIKADRDVWRETALEQKGLVSKLLENDETTLRLLRALPHVEDVEDR